ncbi:amidohydrolase family protein [Colwellia piezophila]|uniref:amidohydrolase family protein n=1 Tax=Colwellia piezophila TaxID=211668 RepID=UPI0003672E9D|nr:amidohydrolase family protein [Colwellia piezophila]
MKKLISNKRALIVLAAFFSVNVNAFENLNTNLDHGQNRAFIGANILNPNLDISISNATILVSKGKIVKIQPHSEEIPESYSVTNIENKWVIPGLIDGHVHLSESGGAFTRPDMIDATKIQNYEEDQKWLLANMSSMLQKYTALGITTIFDMGGPSEYIEHYRTLTKQGIYPDIYAAGALLAPMEVPKLNVNGEIFTKVTNAQEAKKLVESQLALHTDIIKIVWAPHGGFTTEQLYSMYQPAIALAKQHNKIVAVHVQDLENAKRSIEAGADILVHGVLTNDIDDEFISLMKKYNVTYMPTLSAFSHYIEIFNNELQFTEYEKRHGHTEIINSFQQLMSNVKDTGQMFQMFLKYIPEVDSTADELAKFSAREQSIIKQLGTMFSSKSVNSQKNNLKKIIHSGVNVALGTDAGNPGTLHASSLVGEMIAWQQAGISNKDILKAATFGNAQALNLTDTIGTLISGKDANFVVLDANPYKNLTTLSTPVMTIKRGKIAYINGSEHDGTH